MGLPIFLLSLVIVFSFTPRYTAQSLGLVDTSSKNLLDPDAATTSGLTDNSRVEGEVRIIQSDAVLLEAIREGKLLSDPEFALNRFSDRLLSAAGLAADTPSGDAGRVKCCRLSRMAFGFAAKA